MKLSCIETKLYNVAAVSFGLAQDRARSCDLETNHNRHQQQ